MIQSRPSAQWANSATSPAVAKVPDGPERRDGERDGAKAAQPDRRAAVEQDHDERDGPDPLDRVRRRSQGWHCVRRRRSHDEKHRGGGQRKA